MDWAPIVERGVPPGNRNVISGLSGLAVSIQRGGVEPLCPYMRRKAEQYIFACMYLKLRMLFVCCLLLPLNVLLLRSHRRLRSDH